MFSVTCLTCSATPSVSRAVRQVQANFSFDYVLLPAEAENISKFGATEAIGHRFSVFIASLTVERGNAAWF